MISYYSSRRLGRLAVVAALVAVLTVLGSGTADAAVNQTTGMTPGTAWLGDCKIVVGSVWMPNGAAVGGSDVSCTYRHSRITAKVTLFRADPGQPYRTVATSGWQYRDSTSWFNLQTYPPICGGPAWWYVQTTVNVDGRQIPPVQTPYATWYDPISC
jgi:hypothetical protein